MRKVNLIEIHSETLRDIEKSQSEMQICWNRRFNRYKAI